MGVSTRAFDVKAYERLDDEVCEARRRLPYVVLKLRCGKCRRVLAEGSLHPEAPTVVWDFCGQFSTERDRSVIRHSLRRSSFNHSRPNVRVWESTLRDPDSYAQLSNHQFTVACVTRCGMRRSFRNERAVRAFISAQEQGRKELVLGVDL